MRIHTTAAILGAAVLAACSSTTNVTSAGPAGSAREPSFGTPKQYGTQAFRLMPTDFNGDGHQDLVAALADNTVGIMRNNGDGSFAEPIRVRESANAVDGNGTDTIMTVADVNGDGKGDVVFTATSGNLYVVLGNAGGVTPTSTLLTSIDPTYPLISLASADINGDGTPDILQCKSQEAGVVFLDHAGKAASHAYLKDPVTNLCAGGDFNKDGKADIVVESDGTSIAIELTGADGMPPALGTIYGSVSLFAMSTADVNGDGVTDVVALSDDQSISNVVVWLAHADGTLAAPIHSPGPTIGIGHAATLAFADFNRDGHLDVVTLTGGATIMLGDGAGGFSRSAVDLTQPGSGPFTAITAGDFDGDGVPDIALTYGARTYVMMNTTQ